MENENKNTETQNQETENKEGQGEKTYTQAELDELLQKEGDRRVTEALKKAEKKNADKIKEAEKLAKMNATEKYEYELEQREKAIEEKERALALAENKNEAGKILAEKGMSLELVDFVVAEDAETMNKNIGILDKAFKASVKAEVEKRLGTSNTKKGATEDATITKEVFKKMGLVEKQNLKNEDPELYEQLTK